MAKELCVQAPVGLWRIHQRYRSGATQSSPWLKNRICLGYADLAGILLTQGLTDAGITAGTYAGALYLAVGAGNSDWDQSTTPRPTGAETTLQAELGRRALVCSGYKQDDGAIYGGADPLCLTHRRPVLTAFWTLSELENTTIREVGLVGGRATGTPNVTTDTLLNLLYFPVIRKPVHTDADAFRLDFQLELQLQYV